MLQDLLRPFLLACNHADASPHLMIMAMNSIQYLINRDAILPSDAPNILRCATPFSDPPLVSRQLRRAVGPTRCCHSPVMTTLRSYVYHFACRAAAAIHPKFGGRFCSCFESSSRLRIYQRIFIGIFQTFAT